VRNPTKCRNFWIAIREREEKNIMYEFRARKYLYY